MRKILCVIILLQLFAFYTYAVDAVVLNYDVKISIKGQQKISETFLKIQVNHPNGDKYVHFNLDYSRHFKLGEISGEIYDMTGKRLRKLTKNDIKVSSSFHNSTFYSDHFVKKFTLKHNQYPYIIECRYIYKTSSFIQIADWSPVWDTDIPTQCASVYFTCPIDYDYKIKSISIDPPTSRKETDGSKTTIWKSSYTNQKFDNILMPPLYELLPKLLITPQNFKYIINGSQTSWTKLGQYFSTINKGLDVLTPTEKETINQLTYQIRDTVLLINTLYQYLQDNTRYVNISIKHGGLLTYPATYVCNKKFGDCKALCNYMKALLRYKGIDSQTAMVVSGNNPVAVYTDFPSQQFDHVIICIPRLDTIWLECTTKLLPSNYIGAFTQNRQVLLIDDEKSKLVKSPAIMPEQVNNVFSYHFHNQHEKNVEVNYKATLRSTNFEKLRGIATYQSNRETEEFISGFIDLKNVKINTWQIDDPSRDSTYLNLLCNFSCTSPCEAIGNYFKINHPPQKLPKFETVDNRKFDVRITVPIAQTDTIKYTQNFKSLSLSTNKNTQIESPFGMYKIEHILTNEQYIIIRHFVIPAQTIQLSDYAEFYQFYSKLYNSCASTLFTKK